MSESSASSAPARLLLLLGASGAGRSTAAAAVASKLGMCALSAVELLRRRKLDEDIELDKLIGAFLDNNPSCERNGVILHGVPLDVVQTEQLFAQERCRPTHVINLDVPERVLDQRLGAIVSLTHDDGADRTLQAGRLIHPATGRRYHTEFMPPRRKLIDDESGEHLVQYEQDRDAQERHKRLQRYKQVRDSLLAFAGKKLPLQSVDGNRSPDVVCQAICDILKRE